MILSELRRMPLLRAALPFMAGILVGNYWRVGMVPLLMTLGLVPVIWLIALRLKWPMKYRWVPGVLLLLFMFSFGVVWQQVRDPQLRPGHFNLQQQTGELLVEVERNYGKPRGSSKHLVRIKARKDSTVFGNAHGKALVTLGLDSTHRAPKPGDVLFLSTYLKSTHRVPDPGGFDRSAWAKHLGAVGEAYISAERWTTLRHHDAIDGAGGLRAKAAARFRQAGLRGNELALARALLLGERRELDPEQRNRFVQSGTIHVLAVSGLHVGLIFVILSRVTRFMGKSDRSQLVRMMITISGIWAYAWLTGSSPSVVRASVMFSLFTIAGSLSRQTMHLNSLAAAAIIILLWDPAHIMSLGFQLSFLAVLGIILFYRPIFGSLPGSGRWFEPIWVVATVSIAAQIATAPLSIHAFGAFPIWFLPANVIIVSLVTVVVNLGVGTLVLSPVPLLSTFLTEELSALLRAVERISAFFAELPLAYFPLQVDLLQCLLLYALLLSVALLPVYKAFYRWIPVSLAILFLGSWMWKAKTSAERVQLTVYDTRDNVAFSLVTGRSMFVHADHPDQWVNRKVQRHANAWGITDISWSNWDKEQWRNIASGAIGLDGSFMVPGVSTYVIELDKLNREMSLPSVDVVLLQGEGFLDEECLQRLCVLDAQFVIASDVPWKSVSFIQRELEGCGRQVHVIKKHGAFIFPKAS